MSLPCSGTFNTLNPIQQAPHTSLIEFIMSELERNLDCLETSL